ncbi:MAG: universal stress protein [Candidatus Nanohaloarchaea archaeon]
MYERILLPTDGSEESRRAVPHARSLAEKYDAEVHVLYVVDLRVDTAGEYLDTIMGEIEEEGERATESVAGEFDEAEEHVRRGIPHEAINEFVEEKEVDLIVMGSLGKSGLERVLLGSTAEKVIRTAEVPVMTVGPGREE